MSDKCPHCGLIHETTCHLIKAIEYHADGVTVKRIEFHSPLPQPESSHLWEWALRGYPVGGQVGMRVQPTGGVATFTRDIK